MKLLHARGVFFGIYLYFIPYYDLKVFSPFSHDFVCRIRMFWFFFMNLNHVVSVRDVGLLHNMLVLEFSISSNKNLRKLGCVIHFFFQLFCIFCIPAYCWVLLVSSSLFFLLFFFTLAFHFISLHVLFLYFLITILFFL